MFEFPQETLSDQLVRPYYYYYYYYYFAQTLKHTLINTWFSKFYNEQKPYKNSYFPQDQAQEPFLLCLPRYLQKIYQKSKAYHAIKYWLT